MSRYVVGDATRPDSAGIIAHICNCDPRREAPRMSTDDDCDGPTADAPAPTRWPPSPEARDDCDYLCVGCLGGGGTWRSVLFGADGGLCRPCFRAWYEGDLTTAGQFARPSDRDCDGVAP